MALRKYKPSNDAPPLRMAPLNFSNMAHEKAEFLDSETDPGPPVQSDIDIDLREVYFLIMHFLSAGPCHRTYGQFWNELLEHQLLPRRHHAWYSRSGVHSGDENDNDSSLPLSYNKLVQRYPHIETDHLVKLLKQLISSTTSPLHGMPVRNSPNAADVPTLLGSGSFSLLGSDRVREDKNVSRPPSYERWPHMRVDQVRGLSLREIGGGFAKHHRAPSIRAACYAIAKPSTMVQKMQNIKKLRGHRDAVYCATFDRSGRYVVTGSDDRLVKIWSMETAFCLAGCRGHEGDITDLAVSSNNAWVASASNDCIIRVWRLPDGMPVAVLRGHTGAVTAIAFSPRPGTASHLLSSSDDGTCRIWDIRNTNASPRIYIPKPSDVVTGKSNGPSTSTGPSASTAPSTSTGPSTTDPPSHQILCCAYNASGTVFVTGSSDTYARVWNALKSNTHDCEQPNYEMDVLSGHENDVNYVQFSGCAVASRTYINDTSSEENVPKFKNSCFTQDNIVTCSRDGSAIIWVPRSRRSHSKVGRWTRAYHLKVPPPPLPPQPPRGGPRQRFVPIPRGVNMIVWSLDNRFVLAAIMDCRICVWNAVDGSLVHSLTGHSESTYVLDVHPFNPRIAMSAGYDGKTIIWDIWEGTPIQIYEIGRFKLVDGKFSPDGTSIILSDDVGQICILNTGQGESQKDAKYDQFFLGDYRPLIQDTHGNVLDQESQLPPYRRNIQDLLCDSSMMPYSEPYQSMFQQRRLGALGIERRFPSLKFAVGPVEIGGLQDYQMLPLPDLDRMIEPMPEFIDAMDWEPEIEVHSDDNDSEYNVTDDCSSEGGQGSFRTVSSGDTDCSVGDSDVEHSKNGLRKSKRKKHKVEFTTSSGRRVKRRNLDERDGTPSLTDRTKRSRSGKKSSRRRSSTSNSSRPQRVAARNARNFFSRITGVSTDEDEETPESESMLQDSDNQSNDSDRSMQNEKERIPKGQEVFVDNLEEEIEIAELHKSEKDARNKRMKVVKFSLCDSTKPEAEKRIKIVGSSSKSSQETFEVNRNCGTSEGPGCSSGDLISAMFAQNHNTEVRLKMQSDKVENSLNLSAGYQGNEIRWGEVKARTTKHLKFGARNLGSISKCDEHGGIENNVDGHLIPESECIAGSSHPETCDTVDGTDGKAYKIQQQYSRPGSSEGLNGARNVKVVPPEYVQQSILLEQSAMDDNQHKKGSLNVFNRKHGKESMDQSGPREIDNYVESHEVTDVCHDATRSAFDCNSHPDDYQELRDDIPSISTKLRLRSRKIQEEPSSSSKLKYFTPVEDRRSSECDLESQSPSHMENEEWSEVGKSEAQVNELSKLSKNLYTEVNNKRYNAVYTRCKSSRTANASKNCGGDMDESTSNDSSNYVDLRMKFTEATADVVRRTRSMSMKATTTESNGTSKLRESNRSVETSRRTEKNSLSTHEQLLGKECEFNSTMTVGLRSTRNRRGNCYANQTPVSKRKTRQSFRKLSWLMLLEHEENYRYIPQLGDEVVYLRQGHQGYIESSRSSEQGPWRKYKSLKAVEFCKVEYLDYSTFPGSGESCCKIKLEFVDPSSSVFGDTFSLTLPELRDFSDFLVERTRYDTAISRNWTKRDKCRVWWYNSEEGGNWWDGRIVSVQPKSPEFPDSPWEKYTVQYKSDAGQIQQHSPWELHDYDTHWKHPQIDDEIRNKVLSLFAKLQQSGGRDQDPYGLQKLEQVTQKSDFLNRFPVSLSLEVIQVRLEQNYYRTLEAVKHDFTVMLSNAQRYFTKNTDLISKMGRLSEWFNKKLLPL